MNTCKYAFGEQMYVYPLSIYLGTERLGHRIYTCLVLIILPDGFLICLQRFILSLSDSEGSTSSYSHQHYSLFLLIMFTESHWGFNFHFLDEQ